MSERRQMIDSEQSLPVTQQCRLLAVARSTAYYRPAPVSDEDLVLMRCIDEAYLQWPFLGSRRMRDELDKSDPEWFDLKQGTGGIGDIEFLVQYLVLANADAHPAVVHYPDNIRQLATLAAAGCLDENLALRLQDVYRDYRLRLHHRTLNEQKPLVRQAEFAAERADVTVAWERFLGAGTA